MSGEECVHNNWLLCQCVRTHLAYHSPSIIDRSTWLYEFKCCDNTPWRSKDHFVVHAGVFGCSQASKRTKQGGFCAIAISAIGNIHNHAPPTCCPASMSSILRRVLIRRRRTWQIVGGGSWQVWRSSLPNRRRYNPGETRGGGDRWGLLMLQISKEVGQVLTSPRMTR